MLALIEYLVPPRFGDHGAPMLRWAFEAWPGVICGIEEEDAEDAEHIGEAQWLATIAAALRELEGQCHEFH